MGERKAVSKICATVRTEQYEGRKPTPGLLVCVHFIPFSASRTIKSITAFCTGGVKNMAVKNIVCNSLPEG